ncbi:MAG: amidohydrolase family protein [Clostridiales bacterium]|nr:amidohydrolase family protein [Clostridiales bacterium]
MPILLKHCRLIPELSDGYAQTYADILVCGNQIQAIQPTLEAPANCQEIDCQGKTLLPGLIDMHNHLNWSYVSGEQSLTDFSILTKSCLSARRFLDCGITTVRDMGSPKRVSVAVRSAIEQGLFQGPRIISGGIILRPLVRSKPADPYHFLRYVSGAEEMTRFVREELGESADWIKLYVNGDPPDMFPEEVRAAVRTAAIHGKKVAAHCHTLSAIHMCLDEGVSTIEHGSYADAAAIEKLKAENAHLIPTLATLAPEVTPAGFTSEMVQQFLTPLLENSVKNISAAYRAGLTLGFGTDTPVEQLCRHMGLEFKMRKEYCGMSNIDILCQATLDSASILGLEHIIGQVKEGLCADLILVNGNPDADITAMYHRPEMVMVRGQLYIPQA